MTPAMTAFAELDAQNPSKAVAVMSMRIMRKG